MKGQGFSLHLNTIGKYQLPKFKCVIHSIQEQNNCCLIPQLEYKCCVFFEAGLSGGQILFYLIISNIT